MSAPPLVQRFARNTQGRDFVVGDIHGEFGMLRELLAFIHFDVKKDRLFSTGDNVDRGPDSIEILDWSRRGWFHTDRGNHEQLAIDVFHGRTEAMHHLVNGGEWFLVLEDAQQKEIVELFEDMPIAIEIDTAWGKAGIVHAMPPTDWAAMIKQLEKPKLSEEKRRELLHQCLWDRSKVKKVDTSAIENIDWVFVGHTAMRRPGYLGNVVFLDTGAVFGNRLTCVDLAHPTTFISWPPLLTETTVTPPIAKT